MRRSLLLICLAACGARHNPPAGPGTGSASGTGSAEIVMQTLVHFAFENEGGADAPVPKTKIWVVVTDETGAAKSYPLDEIDSACSEKPGGEMEALGTLACLRDGKGANYIAVGRGTDIILLRQAVDPSDDEPSDYEEMTRIEVPVGSKLAYGP